MGIWCAFVAAILPLLVSVILLIGAKQTGNTKLVWTVHWLIFSLVRSSDFNFKIALLGLDGIILVWSKHYVWFFSCLESKLHYAVCYNFVFSSSWNVYLQSIISESLVIGEWLAFIDVSWTYPKSSSNSFDLKNLSSSFFQIFMFFFYLSSI